MAFTPSKYQSAVFDAFTVKDPPARLAVNAVAGSGKTKTIEQLCSKLSVNEQARAIAVCFNTAIRDELQNRLPPAMTVINFHKLGKQIIDSNLRVKSRVEKWKYTNYLQESVEETFGSPDRDMMARTEQALKMGRVNLINFEDDEAFENILDRYEIEPFDGMQKMVQQACRRGMIDAQKGIVEFDDLVCLPYYMNMRVDKYSIILVDECQDLNPAQAWLVVAMIQPNTRVLAVGDPRQAIYGFAGASHNSFYELMKAIDGAEMPLSVCYRCPSDVVALAAEIVPSIEAHENAEKGMIKSLAYHDCFELLSPFDKDMVVCRTAAPLVGLCFDCIKARIPAKIKGRDIATGLTTVAKNVLKNCSWGDFLTGLGDLIDREESNLAKRPTVGKEAKVQALKDKAEALTVLYSHAITDGIKSFDAFTDYVQSFFDDNTSGCVTLSTVHKAKGLESKNVFILGIENFPHPMAQTEDAKKQEMNLKYVAITRSKENLYLLGLKPKNNESEAEYISEEL